MQLGVTFPQNEIGTDPKAIRAYALAVQDAGYSHILVYDHVVSAGPSHGGNNYSSQLFHEPFVLFGYLAALTQMELVSGIIILPQRQTALVAKQAAEVDILTGGKFRLGIGVGWNELEYEALGMPFQKRGKIVDEQITILRRLWSESAVTFQSTYHTLPDVGLNPMPVQRPIPIWMGGHSDAMLRRTARFGNGWLPLGKPDQQMQQMIERLRQYTQEAGRDFATLGIEARINASDGQLDEWVRQSEAWHALGATHISLNTMNAGFATVQQHIDALRMYKEAMRSRISTL